MDVGTALAWLFRDAPPAPIESLDWAGLDEHLERLDARALFWSRLREWGLTDRAPTGLGERLATDHRSNTLQAMRLEHEVRSILDALHSKGIDAAPLKGGQLLVAGCIGDPGARPMVDLDLLTRPGDRARVFATLAELGYFAAGVDSGPKHLPPVKKGTVFVEVHEYAYFTKKGDKIGLDQVLEAPTEHASVHLLHHLFVSSPREPWLAVKTLADFRALHRCARAASNEIEQLAERAGLEPELALVREGLRALEGGHDDPALEAWIEACAPTSSEAVALRFVLTSLLDTPLWYRADLARSMLLPSRSAMSKRYGIAENSRLLYATYALRPLHLAYLGLRAAVRGTRSSKPGAR